MLYAVRLLGRGGAGFAGFLQLLAYFVGAVALSAHSLI
jgi:hypothetical protein